MNTIENRWGDLKLCELRTEQILGQKQQQHQQQGRIWENMTVINWLSWVH